MTEGPFIPSHSRRSFIVSAAAIAGVSALPLRMADAGPVARWHRLNLSDPKFPKKRLDSYKKAISAMLKLPPTDPRNWYRNAFVHTLDCPHGNWWFVVWHRGYIGWFERTCRELSGDPDFALPYWDWTAQPYIPADFFNDVLNPANPAYINSLAVFQKELSNPMSAFWKSLTPAQLAQLKLRGYNSMADVWAGVVGDPMFFPPAQARTLTQANPNFDTATKNAVSISTIKAALAPKNFIDFGSKKAPYHSAMAGFGILEGQPHNLVHNCIGGFMSDFLSPVDPLFFMHHANIDRLWQVWTLKQQGLGLPTLPQGADLAEWSREPFLFYIDAAGKPVAKNRAGDYATIGDFDYDYQPGSGEAVLTARAALGSMAPAKLYKGSVKHAALATAAPAISEINVPKETLTRVSEATDPSTMYAEISLVPPAQTLGVRFNVTLDGTTGKAGMVSAENPHYVAALEFFGAHHHTDKPVTFMVPLSNSLKSLRLTKALNTAAPLVLQVAAESKTPGTPVEAAISAVTVGTF